jgi:hypothetical protein
VVRGQDKTREVGAGMDGAEVLQCSVSAEKCGSAKSKVWPQLFAPSVLNFRRILVTAPNESQVTKTCTMYHLDVG